MLFRVFCACSAILLTGAAPAATFSEAVDAAWARNLARPGLEAQRSAALARVRTAQEFFPDGPTLSGTYDDDHALGSNQGYTTYQAELSTPIWLPGEGTATERVAHADAATVDAQLENARLSLAAQVLEAVASATLGRQDVAITGNRLAVARRVASAVSRAAQLGELPTTDRDQAQADLDQAIASAADAATRATDTEAALASLTGSDLIPRLDDVPPSPSVEPVSSVVGRQQDPRLLVFERKLDSAEQQLRLVRASPMADPDIGVEGIRDKQFGSPWDSRVGLVVHIPLPSRARNLPRLAAASSAVTVAEGELLQARRQVRLGIVQAEATLHGALIVQVSVRRLAADLDRRALALERGWHAGEAPLIELLRAQEAAYAADLQNARADVMARAAFLRALLAAGTVPS